MRSEQIGRCGFPAIATLAAFAASAAERLVEALGVENVTVNDLSFRVNSGPEKLGPPCHAPDRAARRFQLL